MQALIEKVGSLSPQERKALAVLLKQQGVNLFEIAPVFKRQDGEPLRLSYAQERQWFLWQLEPESAAYHIPSVLRLRGRLDLDALQRSFDSLVARHETLRTRFRLDGDEARQEIAASMALPLDIVALGPLEEGALARQVETTIARPFDLERGPLLRVSLLRLAEDDHVLVLVQHHIVSDGWSMQVMVEELVQLYAAYSRGLEVALPALPIQYADYALWQRSWMEAGEKERQLAYWTGLLGGEQPVLELPFDRPRPVRQSHRGAQFILELDIDLSQALRRVAQQEGATAFALLLASFQALLYRYSGQADIRVGVPIANRNRVETERLIGFFVNTQVLKADLDGRMGFDELLAQARQRALEAQAHQDLPFEQLVEALQPERSLSHNPLFQVLFNYQSEARGNGQAFRFDELQMESVQFDSRTAQFDLTLDLTDEEQRFCAVFDYATDLFDASTVERLAGHWRNLLRGIVANPRQRLGELPLLDAPERRQTLSEWNPAQRECAVQGTLQQRFEEQARQRPQAVALILDEQRLSYGELNARANRLAHCLIARGVGADVPVGLALERSLDMLVGLLAILKAGGAYLPLDPAAPEERLAHILVDSGVRLLLTQGHLRERLPRQAGVEVLAIDGLVLDGYAESDPLPMLSADNLAYVIYTSGSTGKPKGTLLTHRNALRLFSATEAWFGFDERDVWTLFHSYAFDFSVWEIFGALLYGGRLVIVPQWVSRSPEDFYRLLCREGVTVLNQTPSAFKQLMAVACSADMATQQPALRYVIFGGEALDLQSLRPWFQRFGDRQPQLVNMYGITETTVHVTYRPVSEADLEGGLVSPIGGTIPDLSWYILDRDLNPVPRGAVGELYIGRAGLARGYLRRPGLSATRFVPNPFPGGAGERLYRTGDLARFQADGNIEYIGRIDHQVKVRGFRIELGEIEAALAGLAGVRDAVVLAHDGVGGTQLVGYVVADSAEDAERLRESLRESLKRHLPDYMVPAHLMLLERMPLTVNGKLDRQALPQPDASLSQQAYRAPGSELEQRIAAIWAEILGVERVGLDDNFFELGGHSLLATRVISRVRQEQQLDASLKALFERPVLEAFAQGLERTADAVSTIPLADRQQPLALSFAQERQWFLWQLEPESAAYHIPSALRLRGRLDVDALQRSFDSLVARHETLRTRFQLEGGRSYQQVQPAVSVSIEREQFGEEGLIERIQAIVVQPFDLERGPLLRVNLLQLAEDDHVLVLVQHHIVSDGWSMQVMVEELVQLYAGYSRGLDVVLPALPIQYADYALWQRRWMEAGEKERQLAYWTGLLGGEQPVLELPFDRPRPARQSHRGAQLGFELPRELVEAVRALAQREGASSFMLLLASFQALLYRYSGQADIRVGVPIANRNRVETERLIGFFVNTQVLKADLDGRMGFDELLAQARQRALEAQAHQDLPFEQLVEALQPERNASHNPLFQVLFNHQSEIRSVTPEVQLEDLRLEGLAWDGQTAQFDLTLDIQEDENGIWASFDYATDLFDASTVERLAGHWRNLLRGIVANPRQRLGELPL
ncbi:TPA: pyoverdine non-ribosomal peptide synthetase PvdD, partial [Pseudomonas aeruginosa]|nr:pyoverdine non-ribosomal peptide synthetase PvdD [Pseudomonas aeruginosa]